MGKGLISFQDFASSPAYHYHYYHNHYHCHYHYHFVIIITIIIITIIIITFGIIIIFIIIIITITIIIITMITIINVITIIIIIIYISSSRYSTFTQNRLLKRLRSPLDMGIKQCIHIVACVCSMATDKKLLKAHKTCLPFPFLH